MRKQLPTLQFMTIDKAKTVIGKCEYWLHFTTWDTHLLGKEFLFDSRYELEG